MSSCRSPAPSQRICRRARQSPNQTRGRVIKVDVTADALLHHRADDRAAEAATFWWRYGGPVALSPAHHESVALKPSAYVDAAGIHRQRTIFAGVGCELIKGETDGLCTSGIQT
jgi:hypothetical protein